MPGISQGLTGGRSAISSPQRLSRISPLPMCRKAKSATTNAACAQGMAFLPTAKPPSIIRQVPTAVTRNREEASMTQNAARKTKKQDLWGIVKAFAPHLIAKMKTVKLVRPRTKFLAAVMAPEGNRADQP